MRSIIGRRENGKKLLLGVTVIFFCIRKNDFLDIFTIIFSGPERFDSLTLKDLVYTFFIEKKDETELFILLLDFILILQYPRGHAHVPLLFRRAARNLSTTKDKSTFFLS